MLTLLIGILAQGAPAIDFYHPGAPVKRAVAAMSEAYGEPMSADGTLDRDFVVVAFKGETAEGARGLLAKALNATWEKKEEGWVFRRTRAQELADERAELAKMVEGIKKFQSLVRVPPRMAGAEAEKFVGELLKKFAAGGTEMSFSELGRMPLNRAIARIKREIDPSFIAGLRESGPVVLGTVESLGVVPFPDGVLGIVREAVEDHNALNALMGARAGSLPPIYSMYPVKWDPANVRAVVYRSGSSFSVALSIPTGRNGRNMDVNDFGDYLPSVPQPLIWSQSLSAPLTLDALSLEYDALLPPSYSNPEVRRKASEELIGFSLDTAHHDLTELNMSELVRQASDADGRSYVVVTSDAVSVFGPRLARKPQWTLADALTALLPEYYTEVEQTDRTVIVRSPFPSRDRQSRCDRDGLVMAIRAGLRHEPLLDPLAAALKGTSFEGYPSVLSRLARLTRLISDVTFSDGKELLAMYSELSPGQRTQVFGDGLVISREVLTEKMSEHLRGLVGEKVRTSYAGTLTQVGTRPTPQDESAAVQASLRLDFRSRFVLRGRTVPVLYYVTKVGEQRSKPFPGTPEAVASLLWSADKHEDFDVSGFGVRVVEQQVLWMYALVDGKEVPMSEFLVPAIYEGDAFEPVEKMPAWVRERYEAERKRLGGGAPERERGWSAAGGLKSKVESRIVGPVCARCIARPGHLAGFVRVCPGWFGFVRADRSDRSDRTDRRVGACLFALDRTDRTHGADEGLFKPQD